MPSKKKKTAPPSRDRVRMTLDLSPDQDAAVRQLAHDQGMRHTDYVRLLVSQAMEGHLRVELPAPLAAALHKAAESQFKTDSDFIRDLLVNDLRARGAL